MSYETGFGVQFLQPAGLGDIIFLQKAAEHFINKGLWIYWPITPEYKWLGEYITNPKITWADPDDKIPNDVLISYHFENAGNTYDGFHMDAKYEMLGLSAEDWMDYFLFTRNIEKEEKLFDQLGLKNGEKYTLMNDNYVTPPSIRKMERMKLYVPQDIPIIKLEILEEFTPFDWCKVIENATNLYLVDTCFTWIIEKLNPIAEELKLFSRRPGKGAIHSSIDSNHLFRMPREIMNWSK